LADYAPLNALAGFRVNVGRIREAWPDMLRVAGSLSTGAVRAHDLMRMMSREGSPSHLGQAFAEYGRIATLHLLSFVDPDDRYRRQASRQLTIQEGRHQLARKIFHGQLGEVRQAYREGQKDQLGALGLVLNAVVFWNTQYMDAALDELRGSGYPVVDDDVAGLSPLLFGHINILGRYAFTAPPQEAFDAT
jgi:TnpA family transposase